MAAKSHISLEEFVSLEDRDVEDGHQQLHSGSLYQLDVDHSHEAGLNNLSDAESSNNQTDDPSEFLSDGLWRKRSVKNGKVKLTNTKEIARYIQRAGNYDKALLKVILETDSTKFPEASIGFYVSELIQKGAKVLTIDEEGNTPLHLAARRGFPDVAKELLRWGADPHIENMKDKTPLEIAILQALTREESTQDFIHNFNALAVLMCKEMHPAKVRGLFLSEIESTPHLNFHDLLDNEDLKDTLNAVMDTQIERVPGRKRTFTVYYDLLESNKEGKIVKTPNIGSLRKLGKSAFEKIAWTGNKEAASHLVVRLMMHSKWRRFARNFLIAHFMYWAVTMIAISSALIIAATQPDPYVYTEPVDIFRGLCEGLAILLVTVATLNEIYHLCLWRLTYFQDYSFFIYNYLNLLTMLFMMILIPLRALQINEEWLFACLLYICYSIRVMRYVTSIKILGNYIHILYLIIQRDLVPFISILLIVLYIFAGGFYFALRKEVIVPTLITPQCNFSVVEEALNTLNLTVSQVQDAVNTSTIPFMTSLDINPAETSTFYRVFFTGIRIAVEASSVLTYFGPSGFGWLGVTTYLIFLFTLEVIMLNLLIAQMSDTFSNVQGDAQRSLAINKARTIIGIEKTGLSFLKCATDFYKQKEKWMNPQKHVEKLDKTSITNIHRISLNTQETVNQHSSVLNDLRDSLADQSLTTDDKLDMIFKKLAQLESRLQ